PHTTTRAATSEINPHFQTRGEVMGGYKHKVGSSGSPSFLDGGTGLTHHVPVPLKPGGVHADQGEQMPRDDKANKAPALEPPQDAIAKRAYELYLQPGSPPGYELADRLQAEAELPAA